MCNWKTKVVALMMAFVMVFSISASSAYAFSWEDVQSEKSPPLALTDSMIYRAYLSYFVSHPAKNGDIQAGWKSILVKEACEFISWLIRKGASNDAIMKKITKEFDKVAADSFKRNSYKIANELERIGEIPDLTTQVVKDKLIYFMKNTLNLNGGTAQVIGEGIAAGINFLIF